MIGRQISHYRITKLIREGGMGSVYQAEDLTLERTVAVKIVRPSHRDPKVASQRFLREAQAVSKIAHTNVITLYEIYQEGDANFLIMQFIDGSSLRDRLDSGAITAPEAVRIACDVASGLEAAHRLGVVHRDVKPENIMLDPSGGAKILDFGVAHLTDRSTLTRKGHIVGTLPYMAPEQVKGDEVDARTDVYSAGVLLFEMLTGELPFAAEEETALFYQILNADPPSVKAYVPKLASGIDVVIGKAMAKSPEGRYGSAAELLHDLEVIKVRTESHSVSTDRLYAQTGRRKRWAFATTALLVAGGIVAVAILRPPWLPSWLKRSRITPSPVVATTQKRLAVIPFTNVGGDDSDAAFCDGLAEILTSKISELERYHASLWVVPASVVRSRGVTSPGDARIEFGVNFVITGVLQRFGESFRLTLNLIDAVGDTPKQVTSRTIDGSWPRVSVLQNETVIQIADVLDVQLGAEGQTALAEGGTKEPGAYEHYVIGRGYLQRYQDPDNVDTAVKLFESAVEKDTEYALAHAGLGEAYWQRYRGTQDGRWVAQAREHCRRAVAITGRLSPVYVTLGTIDQGTGDNEGAMKHFFTALEIDPRNADAYLGLAKSYDKLGMANQAEATYQKAIELRPDYWGGYNRLGVFYRRHGRLEDAERAFRMITELTPENVRAYNNLIPIYFALRDFDSAEDAFERSVAVRPNDDAYINMGTILIYEGKYREAIPLLESAIELDPNNYITWGNLGDCYRYTPRFSTKAPESYARAIAIVRGLLEVDPSDSERRADLAGYLAKSGDVKTALDEIARAKNESPNDWWVLYVSALVHEIGGKHDEALADIGSALDAGGPSEDMRKEPEFRDLRHDPRFDALLGGNETGR